MIRISNHSRTYCVVCNTSALPQMALFYLHVHFEQGQAVNSFIPSLHAAQIAPWGIVIYAHKYAMDEHIQVLQYKDRVLSLDITDDRLAIRIPNGPEDDIGMESDNFICRDGHRLHDNGMIHSDLTIHRPLNDWLQSSACWMWCGCVNVWLHSNRSEPLVKSRI